MKKTITICDRCKREYKPQTASERAKSPRMYGFGEVELDGNTNYLYNTDLCDECYGELIKWWEKYDFVVTETEAETFLEACQKVANDHPGYGGYSPERNCI